MRAPPSQLTNYQPANQQIEVENYDNATIMEIADIILCDTTYWPGDQFEAASPVEASFWSIHPTLDRLLQYKELVFPFKSRVWDTSGQKYCTAVSSTDCLGHHAYDLAFWPVVHELDGVYVQSYLTNQEIRDAIRPDSYV